jgi:hypothetical protein
MARERTQPSPPVPSELFDMDQLYAYLQGQLRKVSERFDD